MLVKSVEKLFSRLSLLIVCNVLFLVLLILKYADYNFEEKLYYNLAQNHQVKGDDKQTLLNFVNLVYDLQKNTRNNLHDWETDMPFKNRFLRSGDMQLLDAYGSCGSNSHVFAELCKSIEIPVRFVQLLAVGNKGAVHIMIEAKINGKWAAVDPLFRTYIKKSDSSIASMQEIKSNLGSYTNQFPEDYPYALNYNNYRYTNWDKIPVIMPLLKSIMGITMGSEYVDTFSLRLYLLNLHKVIFFTILLFYIPFLLFSFLFIFRLRK